jgi:hypothetical protein
MLLRAITLGLTLSVVSIAQGGAVVSLSPSPVGQTYAPGSTHTFAVQLSQTVTTGDKYLRMVQFDLNASDASLGLALPVVHNLDGFPVTSPTDIQFFSFVGVPACDVLASSCGTDHFVVDQLNTAVPPGPRIISATFGSATQLSENQQRQIRLPGDGSPVTVGMIQVTMPGAIGDYELNLVNAAEANVDKGGQLRFGFGCQGLTGACSDPITAWRASGASPALTGGSFNMHVDTTCNPASATTWESVGTHLRGVGDVALAITPKNLDDTSSFSEPRGSGLSRIRVSFAGGTIDAASAVVGNVAVAGTDVGGNPVDLTGVVVGVSSVASDTQLEITFTPALPDFATYTVALPGITTCGGAISGVVSGCATALQGDLSGDVRVRANDVAGARGYVGIDPIDPVADIFQARSDISMDGRIRANDVSAIISAVGHDARAIVCPAVP